jgi:hypothetical protein
MFQSFEADVFSVITVSPLKLGSLLRSHRHRGHEAEGANVF